ncbi:MAG: CHAD domain-containing protein [Phycisphaerales bacterium]
MSKPSQRSIESRDAREPRDLRDAGPHALTELLRSRLRSLAKAMVKCRAAFGVSPRVARDAEPAVADPAAAANSVHALRVACRRAGVALSVAGEHLANTDVAELRRHIRSLRRAAGAVRDCDVQQRLLDHLSGGRVPERARAAAFATRMLEQDRIVAEGGLIDVLTRIAPRQLRRSTLELSPGDNVLNANAGELALRHAGTWAGKALEASTRIARSPDAFHEVRLDLKSLRYTIELLLPVLVEKAAAPIRDVLLPMLIDAQEHMGAANDISSLVERLDRYATTLKTTHHTELLSADTRLVSDVRDLHDRFALVRDMRLAKASTWWQTTGLPNLQAALAAGGITPVLPIAEETRPDSVIEAAPLSAEPPMPSIVTKRENGVHSVSDVAAPASQAAPHVNAHPEAARQRDLWLSGRKLAVIDIGSNSIRLLAVELVDAQTWTVLAEERAMTRLAQGMAANHELSSEAMARSVEAIGRFKLQAERLGVQGVRAFATAAVREAGNKRDFISLVHDRTGLMVELVSARDEGRLTHQSVARVYDLSRGSAGVVDIGGGSLEVVQSRDGIITANTSMPLGAVRLTEAFGGADAASGKNFKALKSEASRQIKRRVRKPEHAPGILVGCGGTFTTLLTLAAATRGVLIERNSPALSTLGPVTRDQLKALVNDLRSLSLEQRLRVPGLPSDRADIVIAGLIVVERLMKRLGATQLHVHPGGFREGLVLRLIEDEITKRQATPTTPTDVMSGVRRLAQACHYEKDHSEHVATLARTLFDQFRAQSDLIPGLGTDAGERVLLEAAAVLHDIGIMVSYEQHHKHSWTIIRHATLPGLSPRQIELVAQIARYHRKATPEKSHRPFAALGDRDQALVSRLAALLRVADGLDRSHAQHTSGVHVRFGNGVVHIEPMGQMLSQDDMAAADDKADLLRDITGSKVDITPGESAVAEA